MAIYLYQKGRSGAHDRKKSWRPEPTEIRTYTTRKTTSWTSIAQEMTSVYHKEGSQHARGKLEQQKIMSYQGRSMLMQSSMATNRQIDDRNPNTDRNKVRHVLA